MSAQHRLGLVLVALGAFGCDSPSRSDLSDLGPDLPDQATCASACRDDSSAVLDCHGQVLKQCSTGETCDPAAVACLGPCDRAVLMKNSVGCEYYAVQMESVFQQGTCFAVFIANTQPTPAKIQVEFDGISLPVGTFARIPAGGGASITYLPYDDTVGVPAGEVAILFLGGLAGPIPECPVPSAVGPVSMVIGSGFGRAFHITSDLPVVAYEINPYGGGQSATTGASLLIPTSAWDKSYVGVNAGLAGSPGIARNGYPSMNIIAMEDYTQVTITPSADVVGGAGVPAGIAGMPLTFTLHKGFFAQLSQSDELTGSLISADKPLGLLGGHTCLQEPRGTSFCDHAEQMIPPIHALGSEYAAVMYRPRAGEPAIWRLIGAVDGTQLDYSSNVGGPATLGAGQLAEFSTATPFVVKSQDLDHPFLMFELMSGSTWTLLTDPSGLGNPDFVLNVPPLQYGRSYVTFADPTYPETNLVLIRAKENGAFADVVLDCAGTLSGWQPFTGNTDYEWMRTDLSTGNFTAVGACSNGRHEVHSDGPFGMWVWGWGTPLTTPTTANVSYGYPAGMTIQTINNVPL